LGIVGVVYKWFEARGWVCVHIFLSLYIVMKLIMGPSSDVLVDAQHGLPEWYAPGESAAAHTALGEMIAAAEQDGLRMAKFSGYRDFGYQEQLYAREQRKWPGRVDEFIARPGHSEHQLGTAFDIAWPGLKVESLDDRNLNLYRWVQANAHKYGFIISYPFKTIEVWPYSNRWKPIGKGFMYEPWHIRYVGVDLAAEMVAAGYLDPESTVQPGDFYRPWP
jgi:D-alanyl-D-alanine carboxypeptidase